LHPLEVGQRVPGAREVDAVEEGRGRLSRLALRSIELDQALDGLKEIGVRSDQITRESYG
jgi:hypothetical protein